MTKFSRAWAIPRKNKHNAQGGYYCPDCGAPVSTSVCRGCFREGKPTYFASKREHAHFLTLLNLQKRGIIKSLELQPRFDIVVCTKKIGRYRADFRFYDEREKRVVIQDVKGMTTRDGELRRKIVEALYGIEVEIVR